MTSPAGERKVWAPEVRVSGGQTELCDTGRLITFSGLLAQRCLFSGSGVSDTSLNNNPVWLMNASVNRREAWNAGLKAVGQTLTLL